MNPSTCEDYECHFGLMLDYGANPNIEDKKGNNAFHIFFEYFIEDEKILDLLVGGGGNINHQNKKGETPLHHIVKICTSLYQALIDNLFEYDADPNICNNKGKNFWDVCEETFGDFVEVLKESYEEIKLNKIDSIKKAI